MMLTFAKQKVVIAFLGTFAVLGLLGTLRADMNDRVDQQIQQEENQQSQMIDDQLGGYKTEEENMESNTEFQDFQNVQPGFNR